MIIGFSKKDGLVIFKFCFGELYRGFSRWGFSIFILIRESLFFCSFMD